MDNNKVNILLVDDRPEGLVTLEAVLDDPSYNLITAGSGREALSHVLNHDFAVILMDVQMPEMDGFETTKFIKQREKSRNIPIIFMTANNKADHYISIGYSVGAVDYVLKPFDSYILKSKVSVFVELYRKNQLVQQQAIAIAEAERRERLRTLYDLEQEGRRRYQNLADAIPQIVFRASRAGQIDYFNQFWLTYTGLNLSESVGNLWREVVHRRDYDFIEKKWHEAQAQRQGFECECRLKHAASGVYRWHLLRVVPETNNNSEFVFWIGVATDIHDQKTTQQELLTAKKLADAASETKSNFLANMSHEIRTPLGVILGFSELLIDPKTSKDEKNKAISAIRRNGDQLSKIIDEILDLSKVEAGKMDFEKAEVGLIDLLNSIRDFMNLPAKEKGINLEFIIESEIPSKIYSNATRIQQVLVNLIGNAIKFSPQGSVTVSISYQAESDKNHSSIVVNVKDTGPGMTAGQIEGLFQPFSQVDTSMTRKHGGTGLGLALSRRLARALGGDIVVHRSRPGEGSEFLVTLPTGPLEGVEFTRILEIKKPLEKKIKTGSSALKGIKVLLVEDSVDNQVLVNHFLTMEGAQVEFANNGIEGVSKATDGDHDVILMDIQMPELDGYGAISRLRREGFAKPIIALTAHGMIEDKQRCLDVGANAHLTKPVNRMALIEQVQHFASQKQPEQVTEIQATLTLMS